MKTKTMLTRLIAPGLALALGVIMVATTATATPYATCLTNNAGTVSFRLNEDGCNVKVVGNGGTLTNDLGVIPVNTLLSNGTAGLLIVTNLSSAGGSSTMTGGAFFVIVEKGGTGIPSQINVETNRLYHFYHSRGVAVNRRPASPYFGRVYVANSIPGTAAASRNTPTGIYVIGPDGSNPLGMGYDPGTSRTGGTTNEPAATSSSTWFNLTVGEQDDMVYRSDWTDNHGNLWVTDPDIATNNLATNVLALMQNPALPPVGVNNNHGSVACALVTGRLADGNLTVYTGDEDYESDPSIAWLLELNSLWRYDITATSLPYSNAPNVKLATPYISSSGGQVCGIARHPTLGYLYYIDSRENPDQNILQVIDPSGPTELYRSMDETYAILGVPSGVLDFLQGVRSIAVSSDGQYLACMQRSATVIIVPLEAGIPKLARRFSFNVGTGTQNHRIAFDAANNVYVVSSSNERCRVYSLGLSATAITGSNPAGDGGEGGSFTLVPPADSLSVSNDVATPSAYEAGNVSAWFTLTRTNAAENYSVALPVNLNITGTATRGANLASGDYVLRTNGVVVTGNSIRIPAGTNQVWIEAYPTNDVTSELTETIVVALGGGNYSVNPSVASVTLPIVDDETPMADLAVVQASMYERLTNDYVRLRVIRRGNTNVASFNVNLTYTGTAAPTRYTAPASVAIDPGVVSTNFDITPVNDNILQGNETIIANVASGSGYLVGTNSPTATATIVDDEVLPETTVLYSENFNTDNSANWTMRFGSGNGIEDYRYQFSYDYASGATPPAIPPAPHSSGDTLGCYLTVNKDEGSALGAAGINLYPSGQSFSGNYAVRFDMYVMVGNAASTTEYALFGINHSGNNTNWFRNSSGGVPAGWAFDGLFYGVEADGAALGDYVIYSAPTTAGNNPTPLTPGVNASTLTATFKLPPFGPTLILPGAPGCDETSTTPSWSDVEIDKVGSLVRLMINKTPIMTITNSTAFTAGNIMLGYCDAYDSVMSGNSCVIYDNLRVVRLDDLKITNIQNVGANAEVTFTWGIDDPTTVFKLQSSTVVGSGYTDATATITKLSPGVYKATIAKSGAVRFYRIRYAP